RPALLESGGRHPMPADISGTGRNEAIKGSESRDQPAKHEAAEPASETEEIGEAINSQTVVLSVIAGLLVLFTIYAARSVVMPLVLACMFNLILTPLVLGLARLRS